MAINVQLSGVQAISSMPSSVKIALAGRYRAFDSTMRRHREPAELACRSYRRCGLKSISQRILFTVKTARLPPISKLRLSETASIGH
jgi:hypothetical protein